MIAFLDMDGVITDFARAMCKAHGLPILGLSIEEFWEPCKHESFWVEMEWMPDGKKILEAVEKIGPVFILTSPTFSSQGYSGKIQWIEKNAPKYVRRTILCPSSSKDDLNKAILARADRVLIDDMDHNIDAWVEAGGVGILVPRPWNSSKGSVNRMLEALC